MPDAMRGRLMGLQIAVVTGGPRLGDVESGAVAAAFGDTVSAVSGGLACVAGGSCSRACSPASAASAPSRPTTPAARADVARLGTHALPAGSQTPATLCAARHTRTYRGSVLVKVSTEAAGFVHGHGGVLWVWAAYPRMCCSGTPAWMHAATEPPAGLSGFSEVAADGGVRVWFRGVGGRLPEVLEIGLRGRRRPRVEAYWDGCLMAMF